MAGGKRGSTPPERRPSLRGVLMADTTRGAGRLRAWPRTRGRGGTKVQKKNQQNFMNAQRATKYFAPQMYLWFMQQVEDSPLLPRDAMTMMLYNRLYAFTLETGRTLWPMPAYYDVSGALDVITNEQGQTLVRGANGWIAATAPGPSAATQWKVLHDIEVVSPEPHFDLLGFSGYNEYMVIITELTASTSGHRKLLLSTNNGMSFYNSSPDYIWLQNLGAQYNAAAPNLHSTAASGARSGAMLVTNNGNGTPPWMQGLTHTTENRLFIGSTDPINAARIMNSNGGNITGGRIIALGR